MSLRHHLLAALFIHLITTAAGSATRPNIVLVLVDDFGRELISSLGGESYQTPNIDRLATDGLTFDICYATPLCSPTRNMLLSGQYSFRNYTTWGEFPFSSHPTIADSLSAAGYATAVTGKWHMGGWGAPPYGPTRAGFDHFTTFDYAAQLEEDRDATGNFYWNTHLWVDGQRQRLGDRYTPAAFRRAALHFIRRHQGADTPFFLYYPMVLTHRPFSSTTAPDRGRVGSLSNFPAMVSFVDETVAALREALDRTGQADNTLLLFTADNGTDNVHEAKQLRSQFHGESLAGGKYLPSELGANVPLFAVWPGTVEPGSRYSKPIDFTDLFPTLCHLAGVDPPTGLDGHDFTPVLRGTGESKRQVAYTWGVHEHSSRKYKSPKKHASELLHIVRDERWKYRSDNVLFDLSTGLPQGTPLPAHTHHEVRSRMREALHAIRNSGPKLW